MNREFALSLLTEKRDLLKKILEYNHLTEKTVLPDEIMNSGSAQRFLDNHALIRKLSNVSDVFFEFENPVNRLCFCSEEQLEQLSKLLCAAICSQILVSDIKKEKVLMYREYLGEEIYSFGLRRGSLYIPPHLKSRIVSSFSSNEEAVKGSGNAVLSSIISRASAESMGKIAFKPESSVRLDLSDSDEKLLFECTVKILCLEIDESCQNIFN
ncbi:hypothetical protein [Succinivibrio dextrinosolvens]|uniref:Uncharacterized protein n=1 Tax=Succinivibrio dextrinosolvens TaxID=83771 RepID=A0A662Z7F8_9GAMM|nr:hypothetical protein [Succinivibrio dextrinosolvens]SFJ71862.1 hypothetical protein SAMN04487865_10016 [Succinivibrio dextrinosolvens]